MASRRLKVCVLHAEPRCSESERVKAAATGIGIFTEAGFSPGEIRPLPLNMRINPKSLYQSNYHYAKANSYNEPKGALTSKK